MTNILVNKHNYLQGHSSGFCVPRYPPILTLCHHSTLRHPRNDTAAMVTPIKTLDRFILEYSDTVVIMMIIKIAKETYC